MVQKEAHFGEKHDGSKNAGLVLGGVELDLGKHEDLAKNGLDYICFNRIMHVCKKC